MIYDTAVEHGKKGKSHETRFMTASWVLQKSVQLADIMSTAGWYLEITPR